MDVNKGEKSNNIHSDQHDEDDLRRGPWTVEEDLALINYIATHGEGRWNSLARCAGLKRTGKSCRLRWLNYLRPDVRRGNITLEEQLLILELHSRWGNRWSKIAQYLPGRTDNEIKNYWRTRVQKHAKQLKCDVNSKQFKDTMRYLWMPRLVERIQAAASTNVTTASSIGGPTATMGSAMGEIVDQPLCHAPINSNLTPENSGNSSESYAQVSEITDYQSVGINNQDYFQSDQERYVSDNSISSSNCGYYTNQGMNYQSSNEEQTIQQQWYVGGDTTDNLWNVEDMYFLQQQLSHM